MFKKEKTIFIWREFFQWEPVILGWLNGHDLTEIYLKYTLADRIKDRYSAIRMFHGCRPEKIETYYSDGLMPLEKRRVQELHEDAQRYFLNDRFPEVSPEIVEGVLTKVDDKLLKVRPLFGYVGSPRKGRIDLALDDRFLIKRANHYLIYGSEYLLKFATELGSETKRDSKRYRNVLKGIGIPTIFECDVPVERIDPEALTGFAGNLLQLFAEVIPRRKLDGKTEPPEIDCTFSFYSVIEHDHIISHFHPKIRDPDAETNTSSMQNDSLTPEERTLVEEHKKKLREEIKK